MNERCSFVDRGSGAYLERMNDMKSPPAMVLDHLTILSRDAEVSARFYDLLLPLIGFRRKRPGIWFNDNGLFLQFRKAQDDSAPYQRYGAGLNHFGFRAPSRAYVEHVHQVITTNGHEARLQKFGDGTWACFIPDPDGLRLEIAHYPKGTDPVD